MIAYDQVAAARFERQTKPSDASPADAAARLLEMIADGQQIDHVIIIYGCTDEAGGSTTGRMEAGTYGYHARVGLMVDATSMLTR